MQCKCGGDCPTDTAQFGVKQAKEAGEYSHPLKPERLPVTVRRGNCKACGRLSISFYYDTKAVTIPEPLTTKPEKTKKVVSTAKPLWGSKPMPTSFNQDFAVVAEFLEAITKAKGGDKKNVLENYKGKPEVLRYIKLVLDPSTILYQTLDDKLKQPLGMFASTVAVPSAEVGLIAMLEFVRLKAAAKETRAEQGVLLFRALYAATPKQFHYLLDCFVLRSLKAGAGVKTINSVYPNAVREFGYQRCESGTKQLLQDIINTHGVAYIQEKEDGMFLNVVTDRDGIIENFYTRNGNILVSKSLAGVADEIQSMEFCSKVILGECLVYCDGVLMDRASGNGMLNSIIQTGEDIPENYTIVMRVWDYVERSIWEEARNDRDTKKVMDNPELRYTPYEYNFETIELLFTGCKYVTPVWNTKVQTVDEAMSIFKDILKRGGEGIVAKAPRNYWFDGTSKSMLKFKAVIEADFICVGVNAGDPNGKYADLIGSLQFESSCGKIRFGCSGMSDEFRKLVSANPSAFVGGVFAIKFNQVVLSPDGTEEEPLYSVTFPRLASEKRLDKLVADDMADVEKVINSYFDSL